MSSAATDATRPVRSVGRRFTYALTAAVTLVLLGFAIAAIVFNIQTLESALETRLDNAADLSGVSLRTPLWNVDADTITDVVEALRLDDDVVFAEVLDEVQSVARSAHERYRDTSFEDLLNSSDVVAKSVDISYQETPTGKLRLAMSRDAIREQIILNIGGIIVLTAALIVAIAVTSVLISRRYIVQPLSALQRSANLIAGGQLDTPIDATSPDEVGLLAADLNVMRESIQQRNAQLEEANQTLEQRVAERTAELGEANAAIIKLNEQLQAENLRMGAELEVTREIQRMLLPTAQELESVAGLEIAGYMEPADEVGGDYYDVLQHDGRVKIGIGDVTGHGLESGVMMVMAQSVVRALLTHGVTDPVQFLDTLNRALYNNAQRMASDKNLTLSLLDYADGEVRLSGQHEEMIVMRASGELELVDTVDLGFPIGLDAEIADFIDHTTVHLEPGDGVVLYTDGITEAENLKDEQFGLERLCEVIRENWSKSAEAVKEAVVEAVGRHIGKQTVYDDITLVVLKQR
ncbi:MAG: SpoIIE family protein phosphatase [Pseudomonadota bacterium]